jgi:NTP pyrophosphatase (non-canonical NTP hydrolase)
MNLEEEVQKYMENKSKSVITASAYQAEAKKTAIFPADKALEYLSLGLVGEAGEVANKVKKVIRDGHRLNNPKQNIRDEIGDVLWYCAMLCDWLEDDMGKIMEDNIAKLQSRKKRGVLGGSGDNR